MVVEEEAMAEEADQAVFEICSCMMHYDFLFLLVSQLGGARGVLFSIVKTICCFVFSFGMVLKLR